MPNIDVSIRFVGGALDGKRLTSAPAPQRDEVLSAFSYRGERYKITDATATFASNWPVDEKYPNTVIWEWS